MRVTAKQTLFDQNTGRTAVSEKQFLEMVLLLYLKSKKGVFLCVESLDIREVKMRFRR